MLASLVQQKAALKLFDLLEIESMDYNDEFDIAFCNFALQWFGDPDRAIAAMFNSLRRSGKLGLACPATPNWSPWFGGIISKVAEGFNIGKKEKTWD